MTHTKMTDEAFGHGAECLSMHLKDKVLGFETFHVVLPDHGLAFDALWPTPIALLRLASTCVGDALPGDHKMKLRLVEAMGYALSHFDTLPEDARITIGNRYRAYLPEARRLASSYWQMVQGLAEEARAKIQKK